MNTTLSLKLAPFGESVFSEIREGNFSYVDKTHYIELLEGCGTRFPFIIRPRRFGKTLFTSTLQAYYDRAAADDFEKNFKGTYIGQHKTKLASTFYVLKLDFSGINTIDLIISFTKALKERLQEFFSRYPIEGYQSFLKEKAEKATDPSSLLVDFIAFTRPVTGRKLFVIIDEYDNFANVLLSSNPKTFLKITTTDGFFKNFFSQLKRCAVEQGSIARIFITGVTSISLDSMTSGFSIAKNLTSYPSLAGMYGFSESELASLVPQLVNLKKMGFTISELVARMQEWYNGYRFSFDSDETVFNASMCLYYLDYLRNFNREPDQLLDPSVASDLSKIHGILKLGQKKDVEDIVRQAISRTPIPFSREPEQLNLQANGRLSKKGLLTALVYLGYLTYAHGPRPALVIPNRAMAQQFFDVYFQVLRHMPDWQSHRSTYEAAVEPLDKGDPKPLLECIVNDLRESCGSLKLLHLDESDFQTGLLVAANFAPHYHHSGEIQSLGTGGTLDILLQSTCNGPSYLFELKHLPKSRATKRSIEALLAQARKQAFDYARGVNIRHIPNLKLVVAIFVGLELKEYSITDYSETD